MAIFAGVPLTRIQGLKYFDLLFLPVIVHSTKPIFEPSLSETVNFAVLPPAWFSHRRILRYITFLSWKRNFTFKSQLRMDGCRDIAQVSEKCRERKDSY